MGRGKPVDEHQFYIHCEFRRDRENVIRSNPGPIAATHSVFRGPIIVGKIKIKRHNEYRFHIHASQRNDVNPDGDTEIVSSKVTSERFKNLNMG